MMQEILDRSLGQKDPSGEGNVNSLQYSCLENPIDKGAWSPKEVDTATNQQQQFVIVLSFFVFKNFNKEEVKKKNKYMNKHTHEI